MSLVFDEYGRPYIILREQEKKSRLKGIDAQKANILAARLVSNVARSSLGPKGKRPPLLAVRFCVRCRPCPWNSNFPTCLHIFK